MEQKMVDVLIHIDESSSHDKREEIRDVLIQTAGVYAAAYHDEKPHMIVVEYDPDTVTSSELLEKVKAQDVHAEVIGL